jgi:meso-butanediol dehydrogenase/(S,S)-butanediol dehydrogenase/diacetyl reductase
VGSGGAGRGKVLRLAGKVAIVTGSGSGIGRAIAQLFSKEGAIVTVLDRNKDGGEETVELIRAAGGNATFSMADVSKARDVQQAVESTVARQGKLNVLVNNAAIQVLAKLADTSEEDWDRVQSVNLKGVFLGCKYAIPAMLQAGGGAIVNMASVLGFVGDPDLAAYCAAKGGVIALTRVAALTYGEHGIRVNCICPGDVETPLVQEYFDKDPDPEGLRETVYSKYALRRIASPQEIANAALFLASDESSFVTGSTMVVDGALTIKCY